MLLRNQLIALLPLRLHTRLHVCKAISQKAESYFSKAARKAEKCKTYSTISYARVSFNNFITNKQNIFSRMQQMFQFFIRPLHRRIREAKRAAFNAAFYLVCSSASNNYLPESARQPPTAVPRSGTEIVSSWFVSDFMRRGDFVFSENNCDAYRHESL